MSEKVLLVDDEPNLLAGLKRHLRREFDLFLAVGGQEAIRIANEEGPFAVIVSDMRMPEMSGTELLTHFHENHEQTVRITLTGNADQKTAVDAVNEGRIFRFLNKPCSPDQLARAIQAGVEQYELITAEAKLLNETLAGSVRMLTQVLSLALPEAFGMTQEARQLAREIAIRLNVGPLWQVEMAAMLMRVGCVSLPTEAMTAFLAGDVVSAEQMELVRQTPELGHQLVTSIPRLQPVAEIIRCQEGPPNETTPIAARILKAVGDYQRFQKSRTPDRAILQLQESTDYDPNVVEVLSALTMARCEVKNVDIGDLQEGMVLESHIQDRDGRILVSTGSEVHDALIQKLLVLRRSATGVREPIRVRQLQPATPDGFASSAIGTPFHPALEASVSHSG